MAERVEVKLDGKAIGKVLLDRKLERPLLRQAQPIARKLASSIPTGRARHRSRQQGRPGDTRRSVAVEGGHMNVKRDRVSVWIRIGGAGIVLNARQRGRFTRAL